MDIRSVISIVMLLSLLLIASCYDKKTMKIPNWISLTGIITGICLCTSINQVGYRFIAIVFIFFFGMLGLMGMGDLKLWMMISTLIGFTESCFIVAGAALMLLIHQLIRDRKRASQTICLSITSFIYNRKIIEFEQTVYPFAPYLMFSCILYCVYYVSKGVSI